MSVNRTHVEGYISVAVFIHNGVSPIEGDRLQQHDRQFSKMSVAGAYLALLEMNPVTQDDGAVERETWLGAVPPTNSRIA